MSAVATRTAPRDGDAPRAAGLLDTPLRNVGFRPLASRAGVEVYRDHASRIISVGADGCFDAPPAAVRDVLLDYRRQVGVLQSLARCEVLASSGDPENKRLVVYQRLALPVISDRDFVLVVAPRQRDDGDITITHRVAEAADLPERPLPEPTRGAVRVRHNSGSWHLRRRQDGTTQARLAFSIDIGGWVPKPVARVTGGHEVPAIFEAFRKILARDVSHPPT